MKTDADRTQWVTVTNSCLERSGPVVYPSVEDHPWYFEMAVGAIDLTAQDVDVSRLLTEAEKCYQAAGLGAISEATFDAQRELDAITDSVSCDELDDEQAAVRLTDLRGRYDTLAELEERCYAEYRELRTEVTNRHFLDLAQASDGLSGWWNTSNPRSRLRLG